MKTTVLMASAAVLALTGSAFAGGHPTVAVKGTSANHIVLPNHNAAILYDQSSGSTNGTALVSQEFTDFTSGNYDSRGADDFAASGKHTITEVDANGGYFGWPGPANSFNVSIYKKIKGGKGKKEQACNNSPWTDAGSGYALIDVSACGPTFKNKGFVSPQAVMPFASGTVGEWYFMTRNNKLLKSPGLWENPGNGFASGCTTYTPIQTGGCFGTVTPGQDFMFAILGN